MVSIKDDGIIKVSLGVPETIDSKKNSSKNLLKQNQDCPFMNLTERLCKIIKIRGKYLDD